MGFPIDSKVLGLRDIIKERYRIPIYQRPYEWAEKNSREIGRASVGKECRSRWSPYH